MHQFCKNNCALFLSSFVGKFTITQLIAQALGHALGAPLAGIPKFYFPCNALKSRHTIFSKRQIKMTPFFNDLRKYLPANVHHPSKNVHHIAPQIPIYQKIDFSKTIFLKHNNSGFWGSFARRIRISGLKRKIMHQFRENSLPHFCCDLLVNSQ